MSPQPPTHTAPHRQRPHRAVQVAQPRSPHTRTRQGHAEPTAGAGLTPGLHALWAGQTAKGRGPSPRPHPEDARRPRAPPCSAGPSLLPLPAPATPPSFHRLLSPPFPKVTWLEPCSRSRSGRPSHRGTCGYGSSSGTSRPGGLTPSSAQCHTFRGRSAGAAPCPSPSAEGGTPHCSQFGRQ